MKFHVTSAVFYTVRIKPYLREGAFALCLFNKREIWIWEQVPRARWLELVHHEMWHAYDLHVGHVLDNDHGDSRARRVSAVCGSVAHDLAVQGGEAALMALQLDPAERRVSAFMPPARELTYSTTE